MIEQGDAQFPFQARERPAERRLGNPERFARQGDVLEPAHGLKIPKLLQFHTGGIHALGVINLAGWQHWRARYAALQ